MTDEPREGNICHIEIPAPDLEKAKQFYAHIFHWSMQDVPSMPYVIFNAGNVGGGFDPQMKVSEYGINFYIQVDDIPATLEAIADAGGTVVKEKTEIGGGFGFYGLFKDPNGNQLGVWSR